MDSGGWSKTRNSITSLCCDDRLSLKNASYIGKTASRHMVPTLQDRLLPNFPDTWPTALPHFLLIELSPIILLIYSFRRLAGDVMAGLISLLHGIQSLEDYECTKNQNDDPRFPQHAFMYMISVVVLCYIYSRFVWNLVCGICWGLGDLALSKSILACFC